MLCVGKDNKSETAKVAAVIPVGFLSLKGNVNFCL